MGHDKYFRIRYFFASHTGAQMTGMLYNEKNAFL
jgi:hypothetical protein